jgi:hypothetical protein
MCLKLVLTTAQHDDDDDLGSQVFKDQWIGEGELFLLPANTPHNPVRFEGTVGLVIEVPRPQGKLGIDDL